MFIVAIIERHVEREPDIVLLLFMMLVQGIYACKNHLIWIELLCFISILLLMLLYGTYFEKFTKHGLYYMEVMQKEFLECKIVILFLFINN